ncbi:MAG: hypothetical protein J6Y18_03710 [Candidatus Methanomethylophilaceae archaeon]|nr:hypothetical protein [Candidatus Methanomethylophilaceae archaeon]
MSAQMPEKVAEAGLEDWYASLSEMDRIKIARYIDGADASSGFSLILSLVRLAIADENYRFGLSLCVSTSQMPFDAYQRFLINEEFIDVLIGREMYDDAKNVCNINLQLFDRVKDRILADNGGAYPSRLAFRNRYLDIIVGVEAQYEEGYRMLDKYHEMGLLSDDDLEYRRNSLKVHRLQRTFDGVYTYRPKGE